jgi:DNA repair exonuclease SbcCD ATPase subunit
VKADSETAGAAANEEPPHTAQDSLHQIHKRLVDISELASNSYDESIKHQSAYMSEHQKLLQNVAAYSALARQNEKQQQEIQYYKQDLVPYYDRLVHSQRQKIHELQMQAHALEAGAVELGKTSSAEIEQHKRAVGAATELLQAQSEEIKELENRVKELSAHNGGSSAKRPRHSGPTRNRRCKQTKPGAHRV